MARTLFPCECYASELASLERFKPLEKAYHQFHIRARQGPPEDHPKYPEGHPANYREDMYGNPVLSPEDRAEAEAEAQEENRQQEER